MKIKQYLGTDMRDALRQVRAELGADAVLLSTRRLGQGVEVSAAADSEPEPQAPRAQGAAHAPSAQPAPFTRSAPSAGIAPPLIAAATGLPPTAVPAAVRQAAEVAAAAVPAAAVPAAVGDELRGLRQLLERQLAALAWNDYTRREPQRARALSELTGLGIARELALQVVNELPAEMDAEAAQRAHYDALAQRIAVCGPDDAVRGGVLAVLGAAGAGKTTMVAKLALRWLLEHGGDGLTIVTIDDEHIGAAEQARSLGRLLGVPSYRFANGAEFAAAAGRFADQRLLLVDTPALAADAAPALELALALDRLDVPVQRMLLLPASAQAGVLEELLRRCAPLAASCCAITRCDEAVSLGGAISALVRSALPLAYLSDGPRIPEDLRPARAAQLMARALELARAAGASPESELLAQHFGGRFNAAA